MDETLQQQDQQAAAIARAPRVTLADIEAAIYEEFYINAGKAFRIEYGLRGASGEIAPGHPLDFLTICILTLRNGFTVTGESACVSWENYDETLGRQIARRHAIEKCWPLFGFALRERLDFSARLRAIGEAGKLNPDDPRYPHDLPTEDPT